MGAYFENLLIHSPAKIQGVGPGGIRDDKTVVQGTIDDGSYFWTTTTAIESTAAVDGIETAPDTGPESTLYEPYSAAFIGLQDWIANGQAADGTVFPDDQVGWDGTVAYTEGAVATVVAPDGYKPLSIAYPWTDAYHGGINGFTLQGGDQRDFPGNISEVGGAKNAPATEFGNTDEVPGTILTQGGALFLNAYANHFQLSDNVIKANSGAYGAIRLGTPYVNNGAETDDGIGQKNTDVRMSFNRFLTNGGTNLAGAVGLFSGSDRARIDHNDFCGNSSTEYGGAISQYGLSNDPGTPLIPPVTPEDVVGAGDHNRIDHNKIYLNGSIDEGGAIFLGGEITLPAPVGRYDYSPGTGPINVDHNYIAANFGNDDGGGIRLLMTNRYHIDINDNMITDNVSTHEGGGIALDDAPDVAFYNNTVAKNVTTATAVTSDGSPAPAGLSTTANSVAAHGTHASRQPVEELLQPGDVQQHLLRQPGRQLVVDGRSRDRRRAGRRRSGHDADQLLGLGRRRWRIPVGSDELAAQHVVEQPTRWLCRLADEHRGHQRPTRTPDSGSHRRTCST